MRPYIVQGCAAERVGLRTRGTGMQGWAEKDKKPRFHRSLRLIGRKNAKIAVFIVVFGVHRGSLWRRENKTGISTSSATVMEHPQKNLLSHKSFVMKHMLIICRKVTLIFVKHVGRGWRVVVPARRFVTAARRFVTYRPRDGMFTARGTACLPPEGRHVYRPRGGK